MEVKEFLKKFSSVSNEFIDDFFNIINYNNFENNFSIDIDIICKWLKINKGNLKSTLKSSYTKNIDYTVERIKKEKGSGSGATLKEKILLTPFCFNKRCYIKLWKNIGKYKNKRK
jgi:hypothetical protein